MFYLYFHVLNVLKTKCAIFLQICNFFPGKFFFYLKFQIFSNKEICVTNLHNPVRKGRDSENNNFFSSWLFSAPQNARSGICLGLIVELRRPRKAMQPDVVDRIKSIWRCVGATFCLPKKNETILWAQFYFDCLQNFRSPILCHFAMHQKAVKTHVIWFCIGKETLFNSKFLFDEIKC